MGTATEWTVRAVVKRWPLLVGALWLAPVGAGPRADEVTELRAQIEQTIKEGRSDQIDDLIEIAMRQASAANAPVRLGRIELFTAELEADAPTGKTVQRARKAILHLESAPEATLAAVRWHVSGARANAPG